MAKKEINQRIPFTQDELELILNTPTTHLKDLAITLKRSYDSVRRKRWALENKERDIKSKLAYKKNMKKIIETKNKNQRWSKEEIQILLTSTITDIEIAKMLGRSIGAVQVKRLRLLKQIK